MRLCATILTLLSGCVPILPADEIVPRPIPKPPAPNVEPDQGERCRPDCTCEPSCECEKAETAATVKEAPPVRTDKESLTVPQREPEPPVVEVLSMDGCYACDLAIQDFKAMGFAVRVRKDVPAPSYPTIRIGLREWSPSMWVSGQTGQAMIRQAGLTK